jgi:flagellar operon protein
VSAGVPNAALVPPGIAPAPAVSAPQTATATGPLSGPSFASVLTQSTTAADAPRFSRHALDRISQRGINLDRPTLQRLAGGMSRASAKGSKDAVVFVDNTAFVVSVPNNTVVTAVGSEHMRDHVFTNIDSAVFA